MPFPRRPAATVLAKRFIREDCAEVVAALGFRPGTPGLRFVRHSGEKIDRIAFHVQKRRQGGVWLTIHLGIIFPEVQAIEEAAQVTPPQCSTIGCTLGLLYSPYRYVEWDMATESQIAQNRDEIFRVLVSVVPRAFDRITTLQDLRSVLEDDNCLKNWTLTIENRLKSLAVTLWLLNDRQEAITTLRQGLSSQRGLHPMERFRLEALIEYLLNTAARTRLS